MAYGALRHYVKWDYWDVTGPMRSTYLTARKNILQRINNTQDIKHDSVEISRLINIIKFEDSGKKNEKLKAMEEHKVVKFKFGQSPSTKPSRKTWCSPQELTPKAVSVSV